jgi:RsiW-degrading membrane proteinase PrsW (M82 family)
MVSIFIIGMGLAFFSGGLENVLARLTLPGSVLFMNMSINGQVFLSMFFSIISAPVIEEGLKYGGLKAFFYERFQFNQIADGIFYGVTIALGFSFVENSAYFFGLDPLLTMNDFLNVIISRAVFTTLLHLTTGGIIGFYMGKRKFSANNDKKYVWSLLWAISLHAFFNLAGVYVSLIFLIPSFLFLVYQLRKPEVLKIWKIQTPVIES